LGIGGIMLCYFFELALIILNAGVSIWNNLTRLLPTWYFNTRARARVRFYHERVYPSSALTAIGKKRRWGKWSVQFTDGKERSLFYRAARGKLGFCRFGRLRPAGARSSGTRDAWASVQRHGNSYRVKRTPRCRITVLSYCPRTRLKRARSDSCASMRKREGWPLLLASQVALLRGCIEYL